MTAVSQFSKKLSPIAGPSLSRADDTSTTSAPEQAKSWSLTRDAFLVPTSASPVRHITPVALKIPPKKHFSITKHVSVQHTSANQILRQSGMSYLVPISQGQQIAQQMRFLRVEPWLTGRCLSYRLGKMKPLSQISTPQHVAKITYREER